MHKNLPSLFPWKIYIYQVKESYYRPGDIIKIKNCRFPSIKKSDFSLFLCKEDIATTVFLNASNQTELLNRPTWSFVHWLWEKRLIMLTMFENNLSNSAFELNSCIFWGNRTIIKQDPNIKESFKNLGLVHYLARSGLHLIIFMFVWQFILKILFLSHRKKIVLQFFLGAIYFLLTWNSISFFRALFLFVFFNIATLNKIRSHIFYLLCLTCILFLIYNPMQLFFLDFQLTFGLTFALIWHNYVESQIKLLVSQNH